MMKMWVAFASLVPGLVVSTLLVSGGMTCLRLFRKASGSLLPWKKLDKLVEHRFTLPTLGRCDDEHWCRQWSRLADAIGATITSLVDDMTPMSLDDVDGVGGPHLIDV
jgi:hypothetical protein